MPSTDPLADVLTKIRNASRAKHPTVDVRASRVAERVLAVLKQEGYIRNFKATGEDPTDRMLRIYLKYAKKTPAIIQLVRVSRPGQRHYRHATRLPRVLQGLGVAVISTSRGMMADREAYRQRIGGEVICYVW
jgi:small subunit ribosomal protein S8